MKFVLLCACVALVSAASGGRRAIELDLGNRVSSTNLLAKQIAPLLLRQASMLNYRMIPREVNTERVAPQIYAVAAPQRQQVQVAQVQPVQVQAAPVQVAQVQPVQVVQAAPVQQQQVQTVQLIPVQVVQGQAQAQAQSQYQSSGPIYAAVQSTRNVQYVDVPSTGGPAQPQSIIIGPSVQPLDLEFQSQSSPVSVRQTHIPGTPNPPQHSSHQDEPDLLKQEIVKPIIHEVTEAIQPVRKITQEVRPVQEEVNQLIARGQQQQQTQAVAVQAVPVQTVTVQAAPVQTVAVQAAPVEAVSVAAIEEAVPSTVSLQVAPETVATETVSTAAAPQIFLITGLDGISGGISNDISGGISNGVTGGISGGISGSSIAGGQLQTIPVIARITRF